MRRRWRVGILIATFYILRTVKAKDCSPTQFKCLNDGSCIALGLQCDGTYHCIDESDETSCDVITPASAEGDYLMAVYVGMAIVGIITCFILTFFAVFVCRRRRKAAKNTLEMVDSSFHRKASVASRRSMNGDAVARRAGSVQSLASQRRAARIASRDQLRRDYAINKSSSGASAPTATDPAASDDSDSPPPPYSTVDRERLAEASRNDRFRQSLDAASRKIKRGDRKRSSAPHMARKSRSHGSLASSTNPADSVVTEDVPSTSQVAATSQVIYSTALSSYPSASNGHPPAIIPSISLHDGTESEITDPSSVPSRAIAYNTTDLYAKLPESYKMAADAIITRRSESSQHRHSPNDATFQQQQVASIGAAIVSPPQQHMSNSSSSSSSNVVSPTKRAVVTRNQSFQMATSVAPRRDVTDSLEQLSGSVEALDQNALYSNSSATNHAQSQNVDLPGMSENRPLRYSNHHILSPKSNLKISSSPSKISTDGSVTALTQSNRSPLYAPINRFRQSKQLAEDATQRSVKMKKLLQQVSPLRDEPIFCTDRHAEIKPHSAYFSGRHQISNIPQASPPYGIVVVAEQTMVSSNSNYDAILNCDDTGTMGDASNYAAALRTVSQNLNKSFEAVPSAIHI